MRVNKARIETIDRRVQKTKELLLDSLVSLILEKGYDDITITDIIDRANVGRSTFYAHFESKDHLLVGGDNFSRILTDESPVEGKAPIDFYCLYEHVRENISLARTLSGKKEGQIVWNHIRNIIAMKITEWIKLRRPEKMSGSTMLSFETEAAASAMVTLLEKWVEQGMPFTPGQMADKSHELLHSMLMEHG